MAADLADLAKHIEAKLGGVVLAADLARGELTLTVARSEIVAVLTALREDGQCLFEMLIDLCGVDYPERAERFDVVYHLLSLKKNLRIRVTAHVGEEEPIPSVTGVFNAAQWFE